MADATPSDPSAATAPTVDPIRRPSQGSRRIAEKAREADTQPAKACPEVEKTQPRMLPLLGKPYFACIMRKSHVRPPFQVVVPRSMAPFLPSKPAPATLTWEGRSWGMRFTGGRLVQRLEAGWRGFALDNGLRLGDGCVFELVGGGKGVVFRVQVLRADVPAGIRERAGGYTPSSPILID